MTLPGDSSFPAEYKEKLDECDSVGPALRNLVEKNILPRDIMTRTAFENAMVRIHAHLIKRFQFSSSCVVATAGFDDDSWWLYKRCAASYRHRSLRWHQPHYRRFPVGIGPRSIHRGPQTEWEICNGGCVQDWRHPWFVISLHLSDPLFGKSLFLSAGNYVPFPKFGSSTFPHLFPSYRTVFLFPF